MYVVQTLPGPIRQQRIAAARSRAAQAEAQAATAYLEHQRALLEVAQMQQQQTDEPDVEAPKRGGFRKFAVLGAVLVAGYLITR